MNRLAGFVLIGGLVASSAAASGANASQLAHERSAYLAAPAVQEPVASDVKPLAPHATGAPAIVTQRIIGASQAQTRVALPPGSVEVVPPSSQATLSSCPPARTEIACRKP